MKYYLIAGVGFSEMRTAAFKLIDKLKALHGDNAVIGQPYGTMRYWSHNTETPHNGYGWDDDYDNLGEWGTRLAGRLADTTEHVVAWGPGILINHEKIINHLTTPNSSTPTKTRFTIDSSVVTYIMKTNDTHETLVNQLKADWENADLINEGTGIVNPTAEQVKASKDAYNTWVESFVLKARDLWSNYDDESWSVWGGWDDNALPTTVGKGMTDVTSHTRIDGTTANFTNSSSQYYITTA